MKYRLKHLPQMVMTPIGRGLLASGVRHRAFSRYREKAIQHRKAVIPDTTLVAVIGSLGKTTTSRMVNAALGLDPLLEPRGNTGASLAKWICDIEANEEIRVLETGIKHPGQMEGLAGMIRPDIVVVTGVSTEHRDTLKSLQTTRHEKAFMVRALGPSGTALLNADDENAMWMASQTEAITFTWGTSESADLRAADIRTEFPDGTRFRLEYEGRSYDCRTRLLGWPSVQAATAAVAVGLVAGHSIEDMIPRIADLKPTPCRLEPLPLPNGATLLNDSYKSNIESMLSALDILADYGGGRRIAVFGQIPAYLDNREHRYLELTRRAFEACDSIYIYGDSVVHYQEAAKHLGLPLEKLLVAESDYPSLATRLLRETGPGDVLLPKIEFYRPERLCLLLQGKKVNCTIPRCWHHKLCQFCPMVERGWGHSNDVEWML